MRPLPPVRVLQFGTGMLLRGLCDACIDAARRAGRFDGTIVALQSTERGNAAALNAQRGAFTLIERGIEAGRPVERIQPIGAISQALRITEDWPKILDLAASPDLRVILSNVTEAGFQQESFRARLTALLHARFTQLGAAAPRLFVIPTELVDQNGTVLAAMVQTIVKTYPDADSLAKWLGESVRFCSSLVDRIVTGAPNAQERARYESQIGHPDALITLCEPYRLWAIEGDPEELSTAFQIEDSDAGVVFARSIAAVRERKIRLLNGAHTALAPLALLAGIETVREAAEHALVGPFLRHLLIREIVPSTTLPEEDATIFARAVIERFHNPWLNHSWRVIANDQTLKFHARVLPSIRGYAARYDRPPAALSASLAAHLHWTKESMPSELAAIPGLSETVERDSRILTEQGVLALLHHLDLPA